MDFEKCPNIKFMKIRSVGAKLFHVDGQTNMTKVIVAFRTLRTKQNRRLIRVTRIRLRTGYILLPANTCDTYKSAVRHIHDPMLVP